MFSDVSVDLRLDVADRRVLVAFTASATARLECDRTLDLFDQPVEGDHAVVFSADTPPTKRRRSRCRTTPKTST